MKKRISFFIFLLLLVVGLSACTNDDSNNNDVDDNNNGNQTTENNQGNETDADASNEDEEETPVSGDSNNQGESYDTNDTNDTNDSDVPDEETSDPLANLLERAPEIPTNLEEIIAYPSGPLSGNGKVMGEEPLMEDIEMADKVKDILPEIEEGDSEEYLDKWWRAYHYLFAEDYPDPNQIMTQLSFEQFGNPGLDDERFQFKDQMNVLIILDVSGSMANTIDGKPMMDIAKDSINNFVSDLPDEVNMGLRVYGHEGKPTGKTKEESCEISELVYDFQPVDKQAFSEAIDPFEPTGWTPIGLSLEEAKEDFADYPSDDNTNLVYVVSDGAETCGGDPVKAAEDLVASDIEPIINVIGFNVDIEGQSHLREIADAGGGLYTDAGSEEQLQETFDQAEEFLKKWEEWKKGAKKDLYDQQSEQTTEAIFQENEWMHLNMDQDFVMRRVLGELLDQNYMPKDAYRYFEEKFAEREDLYEEIQETTYQDLKEEIKENYEKQLTELQEEYDENTGD